MFQQMHSNQQLVKELEQLVKKYPQFNFSRLLMIFGFTSKPHTEAEHRALFNKSSEALLDEVRGYIYAENDTVATNENSASIELRR